MRVMPGTKSVIGEQPPETPSLINTRGGWVSPEPSENTGKHRNGTISKEETKKFGFVSHQQLSKMPRKQGPMSYIDVAENIHFVNETKDNESNETFRHNRGRALSNPDLPRPRQGSFQLIGDGLFTRKKSLAALDENSSHISDRNIKVTSRLLNSKSSPNFQRDFATKQPNPAVDRLVSVDEQDDEVLISGSRFFNPMMLTGKNLMRKSKSSLNLISQSRTSTPGARDGNALFDLELTPASPFCSRGNTPRITSSRQSTRSRLEPIPDPPSIINNCEEDGVSPPIYSNGVPITISASHPSTPLLKPLKEPNTPRFVIDDDLFESEKIPKRRHSLDPLSSIKRPISHYKSDIEDPVQEPIHGHLYDENQNEVVFGPAKADVLLNLRFTPTETPPPYLFSSKPQNGYHLAEHTELLDSLKTSKKRRPDTGQVIPALRAESVSNKHNLLKNYAPTQNATENICNGGNETATMSESVTDAVRNNDISAKDIVKEKGNENVFVQTENTDTTANIDFNLSSNDMKKVRTFVRLEDLEKSTLLFGDEAFAVESQRKTNDSEVQKKYNNNTASSTEEMTNIQNQQMDEYVGTFTMGVTEKSNVSKHIPVVNDKPGPVKLVVSEQDSAVSITLTQAEEIPPKAVSNKKGPLSSRAIEATNRLYEPPKKITSRVATPNTPKTQMRSGRTKNKSLMPGLERDRSLSSEKQKVQKAKPKKAANMGSRPSTIAKNKKGKGLGTSGNSKTKPKLDTSFKRTNKKGQPTDHEMASRLSKGREYEVRTEQTLRRMEERLKSASSLPNQIKEKNDQNKKAKVDETQHTPVIQEAYPQLDKEEESLLNRVKVTIPSAPYPRRVKSSLPRKATTNKKTKDDAEFNNLTAKPEKKNKTVRATSAGLVVERGARQRAKRDASEKYVQQSHENVNIPPEFDPKTHIILSGPDWHVVKEKSEFKGFDDKTTTGEQEDAISEGLISKLRLDTQSIIYDDRYAGPLSPIQESCHSGVNSHKSSSSKNSTNQNANNNTSALDGKVPDADMTEERQSQKDTSLSEPRNDSDARAMEMSKVSSASVAGDDVSNQTPRNDSAPNDEGIEVITLPGNILTKNKSLDEAMCSELDKRPNSSSKSNDSGTKSGVPEKTSELAQEHEIETTGNITIKGERLIFSFSRTDPKQNPSLGDADDVFVPEQSQAMQPNKKGPESHSTNDHTESSFFTSCEEENDHNGELDEESEEDEIVNCDHELQKMMRSMRQRSELDAHTLINYRKSQENNDLETNSEVSVNEYDTISTEKSIKSSYWEEYYKSPLEHGVLSRLFAEDSSALEQFQDDDLAVSEVGLKEDKTTNMAKDGISNIDDVFDSNFSEHNSENMLSVPSFLTNSSDNTIVNEDVALPFQHIEEEETFAKNNVFESPVDGGFLSSCNDSDADDMMKELEKTLQCGSDSENTAEDEECIPFSIADSTSFNGLKLTQETLKKHNEHQKEVLEQQGETSSVYKNHYKDLDRQNMASRASAFTRTSEYTQNTDSTMKVELDTSACLGWRKGKKLGSGSFGTVYEGLTRDGQLIAVKLVELTVSNRETAKKEYKQVQDEVDLLKTLQNENVVRLLGTNLDGSTVQIFMEHVAGGSISALLAQYGRLEEKIFRNYTKQILTGVKFLHDSQVVHRDIKGSNVMLMTCGTIKLIDFGCAKRLKENSLKRESNNNEDSRLLQSFRGTSYWMAPEVMKSEKYGPKSDIWSIGCTVYEMATTKPPLHDLEQAAAIFRIGNGTHPMPQLQRPEFSKSAIDFVKKCFIRDQTLRPTACDLLSHRFISRKKRRKSAKEK